MEHQKDDEKNGQIWKEHLFSMLVNGNRTFNFLNFSSRSTIFNILRRRVFINYLSWLFISYKMGKHSSMTSNVYFYWLFFLTSLNFKIQKFPKIQKFKTSYLHCPERAFHANELAFGDVRTTITINKLWFFMSWSWAATCQNWANDGSLAGVGACKTFLLFGGSLNGNPHTLRLKSKNTKRKIFVSKKMKRNKLKFFLLLFSITQFWLRTIVIHKNGNKFNLGFLRLHSLPLFFGESAQLKLKSLIVPFLSWL